MTGANTPDGGPGDDDQTTLDVSYGHGRMPVFMKIAWLLFLVFATYYVAVYLIPSAGDELSR